MKILVEYDGTRYRGWQVQPSVPTVEGELRQAGLRLFGQKLWTIGAARTDSGVHARGQVASFYSPRDWSPARCVSALNSVLPADIVVRNAWQVPDKFHARHDACGKEYRYYIWNGSFVAPWLRPFCWQVRAALNVNCLYQVTQYLIGEHDFSCFENRGSPSASPIKRVKSIHVHVKRPLLVISVRANAFLYRMARNIVGTLVEVGRGAMPSGEVASILASCDRRRAGPTAPARGLFLWRVLYPPTLTPKNSTSFDKNMPLRYNGRGCNDV